MKISKANNRHYGQYFEQAIESTINKEEISNKTGFKFPKEDIELMNKHSKILSDYLSAEKATRVGQKTSNESCDLLVDGCEIEIKYVGSGAGTYFNTSMEYVTNIGFISYHDYLLHTGYLAKLKKCFGDMVSLENISPVSNANSSIIRKEYPDIYNKFSAWEGRIREVYVKKFFEFLVSNPQARATFISDMITKDASGKHIPDRLIVFNHSNETIVDYTKEDLTSISKNDIIELSGYSIKFGNAKATFAWQNGTGLNNPTIRVFI